MSQQFDQVVATVQTTDNTQTTVVSYEIPADSVVQVSAQVLALSSGDVRASWRLEASAGPLSSVLDLFGGITSQLDDRDLAALGWNATIDIDGDDIRVRVDGAPGVTVDWMARLRSAVARTAEPPRSARRRPSASEMMRARAAGPRRSCS